MRASSARRFFPIALLVTMAWVGAARAEYRLDDLGRVSSPDSFRCSQRCPFC